MRILKSLTLTTVLLLLFYGHSFSADGIQKQWDALVQQGMTPVEVITQLLDGENLDFTEVVSVAVTNNAIAGILTVTERTENITFADAVVAIVNTGGVVDLVRLMIPTGHLDDVVLAAIEGGLASDVFNAAIREEEVINQEQLFVSAIENEGTCLMAEALITTGSSVEIAVTRLMQTGADAQVVGTCFGENVPGLGYTPERTVVPKVQKKNIPNPVSAG